VCINCSFLHLSYIRFTELKYARNQRVGFTASLKTLPRLSLRISILWQRPTLARAACMPRKLYVLLALIILFLLLNKHLSKVISVSTGPIFTAFSPYGRYLIADCRFYPYFDGSSVVAMATNFMIKMGEIGLFT